MGAPRNPKLTKVIEELRGGRFTSFSEAARTRDMDPSSVSVRWRKTYGKVDPPGFASNQSDELPDVPDEEKDEASPAERELARRLTDAKKGREANRIEASVLRTQLKASEDRLEELSTLLDLQQQVEDIPDPEWTTYAPDDSKHRGVFIACFSDWHYGEVVQPAEMVWYNAYNMEIAEFRTGRFFERTIHIARQYLAGVEYEGIVVPSLGDIATGNIHEELRETNDVSLYKVIPRAAKWIETGLGNLADEFGKVHVPCVPGNHPRDSKLPRFKKRSEHNADTMIMELVASAFKNDDRVTFNIPDGISADFDAYDVAFRMEHGDEARGGTGIQGAMLPIALRTHRIRKQAEAEGHPFDVLLLGHWHQLMLMPGKGFAVNGAGKGYDEFARAKGFEPEPPQQALLLVTPEHGISGQWPLFVGHRGKEGW